MTDSILTQDLTQLIDGWLEAENNGVAFPVPFDTAWQIAGYTRKDNAKRKLAKLSQGTDYLKSEEMVKRPQGGGAKVEVINLTCDALKHLCLMADTPEGETIRQYFIEVEKKWRLVEKYQPEIATQIEVLKLQADIARSQASMIHDQRLVMEKSESILGLHGPQMLALIQGRPDAVVEKVEKVTETIVVKDGRSVSFEGKSLAELARELGFKSGTQLESWLRNKKADHLICQGFRKVQAPYVPTENIKEIKSLWFSSKDRQLLLGENS